MTDNEALKIAKKQLSQAIHLSECGVNDGIRAMYEDKAEWLCSLIGCINRQKAEIERYKGVIRILENNVETAETEAIREFVEKLKREIDMISYETGFEYQETIETIDSLVKEMTEESNDQQKT